MESTEQIISVLFAVWGTEKGFFKRGREGMLILTSKRIAFVSKTKMNINWWRDEVDRQIKEFKKSTNTIRVSDEYTLERLVRDLKEGEENNLDIPLRQVVSIEKEDRGWGSELRVKFKTDDKDKKYKFVMVKGWATYPVKDPISFLYVNWQPWINAARSYT